MLLNLLGKIQSPNIDNQFKVSLIWQLTFPSSWNSILDMHIWWRAAHSSRTAITMYLKRRSPYFAISSPPSKLLCHWGKSRENSVILKMSNYDPVPWQDVTDKISQWLWTPYSEANCGASDQYKGKFASSSHILTYSLSLEDYRVVHGEFCFCKEKYLKN